MELRVLDRATGFGPGDHVFWTFDGPRAFADAAVAYLSEGRQRGERLLYVGDDTERGLIDQLSRWPERDTLLAAGQLAVRPLWTAYDAGRGLDPRGQSEVLRAETAAAVDASYRGLRVAVDATALAENPHLISQLTAYECAVDAMLADAPATGLCGYDERRVGERLGVIAALHSVRQRGLPGFTAHVRGGTVFLSGEVDLAVIDEFAEVCRAVRKSTAGPLIVDMRELAFIDAAGTRMLARFARDMTEAARPLRFRVARNSVRRCLEVFDLDHLVVE